MKPQRPMKPITNDQIRQWHKGGKKGIAQPDAEIRSQLPSPEYKANWDRIFGKKK